MTDERPPNNEIIRLLHVDDDEYSRKLLEKSLKEIDPGIHVSSVDSKSILSNDPIKHGFDCIAVDHKIPHNVFNRLLDLKVSDDTLLMIINNRGIEEYNEETYAAEKKFSQEHGIKVMNFVYFATQIRNSLEKKRKIKLYVDIAENSKEAIVISVGTVAKFVNNAAVDLVGEVSPSSLLGKDLLTWIADEERPKLVNMILSSTQEKLLQSKPVEVTLRGKDGHNVAIEASISPIVYEGEPAFLIFLRNVEARRIYEYRLKALHNFAIRLNTAPTQDAALNYTFEAMTKILSHKRCSVATVEEGYVVEHLTEGMGDDKKLRLSLAGLGIITKAVRLKKTVLVQDTISEPEYVEAARGIDVRSKLVVPVVVESDVRVILSVERGDLNGFTVEDIELLEILASHLSQTLGMIDKIKERQAARDIYNLLG